MRKKLLSGLAAVEWVLLVCGALMIASMLNPFSDMYNFGRYEREAKKQGVYYKAPKEKQTYFGRSLQIEGIVYDQSELTVLVKACRFGPHAKLPQRAYLKTLEGEEIGWNGSGSSSTIFCAKGYFAYENVPSDLKQVVFTNEAYGESFSYTLLLDEEAQ